MTHLTEVEELKKRRTPYSWTIHNRYEPVPKDW